jgi:hypothetical protein
MSNLLKFGRDALVSLCTLVSLAAGGCGSSSASSIQETVIARDDYNIIYTKKVSDGHSVCSIQFMRGSGNKKDYIDYGCDGIVDYYKLSSSYSGQELRRNDAKDAEDLFQWRSIDAEYNLLREEHQLR